MLYNLETNSKERHRLQHGPSVSSVDKTRYYTVLEHMVALQLSARVSRNTLTALYLFLERLERLLVLRH